ncbi:hypothetical protein J437_LFUL014077 [Ladona fulva]|uniref:Uncharacterized protein n=1 Tax=Ladona fulva TaxID=123851 RepID=A0A8K0P7K1_LADFU|nr:hypothetical protein J437_LFUL014077 [Ladona fulva]
MGRGHQMQQGPGGPIHAYRGPPPEPPGQEWGTQQEMGWSGDQSGHQMANYGPQQGSFQQQQPQQGQQHMQQQHMQQQQGDMSQLGRPVQQSKPLKGIPAVVPDFVIPANKESPTTAAATATSSSGPSFPSAPNFMQKFSEITGAGSGSGGATGESSMDNLLSKGKELIFKKFGLGD